MSPFKEPQPRKLTDADLFPKAPVNQRPPYLRAGGEANWVTAPTQAEARRLAEEKDASWDYPQPPIMVLPDYSPFQLRKAALEAACALQGNQPPANFWGNITALEAYLREGTKPS